MPLFNYIKIYRFGFLEQKEIDKINEYLKNTKPGISAIIFSKTFLSFHEKEERANSNYQNYKNIKIDDENKNLVPVFFHLILHNFHEIISSCIKMEKISCYPYEREILLLPISCFEILKIIPFEEKTNVESNSNKKSVKYII